MSNFKDIKKILPIVPMLLIIGIMPLISYGKVDILSENVFLNWRGKSSEIDFFAYYRIMFTLIMVVLSGIVFFINKHKVIKKLAVYKYIVLYMICIVISVLLSKYKDIAINGFVFRYEGMIALLSYMFILFFSINMIDNKYKSKVIIIVLTISSIIIGVVGILQYFGYDIFQIENIQKLMIPKEHSYLIGNLEFSNADNTKVYSTLANSNYVGSYFALVLPIIVTLAILSRENKILFIIAGIINTITLVLSDSATGIISVGMSVIVFIVLMRNRILSEYKRSFIIFSCIILGILLIDCATTRVVYTKGKNAINELIYEINVGKEKSKLEDILLGGNTAQIEFKNKVVKIESYNDELVFKDEKNNDLNVLYDTDKECWNFIDEKYKDVNVKFVSLYEDGRKFIKFNIDDDISINLTTENDEFKYITYAGRVIDNKDIKYWGRDGMEELLTSRYYIWSRILPSIVESPLFGYGPDTFAAVFPQYDYVGMYKAYDRTNMIVDKAHNMYIQIAEGTGMISLFAFIAIMFVYIKDSISIYLNSNLDNSYNILGISIFMGIVGYLVSGLFNDSVVFITPIFYVLLGIGIRINLEIRSTLL